MGHEYTNPFCRTRLVPLLAEVAEAITDNKIPRKYESAVKKYFGQLDKAADDANSKP